MADLGIFLPSLRGGGAERVTVNLVQEFAKLGMDIDLLLASAEGPYLLKFQAKEYSSIRLIDLKSKKVLYCLPSLISYLRQEQPKILLSVMNYASVVALWAKKLSGVRTKVFAVEHSTLTESSGRAPNWRGRVMPLLARIFYPWAELVVAVSGGVAEDLVKITGFHPEKTKIIYNPVIAPELFELADEPLDHPWFYPSCPPVVLSVGRLTEAKNYPMLIHAFALLRREIDSRLMILGEGEERSKLECLVKNLRLEKDVALPGFVNNPYKYMRKAALFVLASKWEALPTVLIEALALGVPVVSTDCPSGPREILEGGKLGRLVPVGDVEALARTMRSLLVKKYRRDGVSKDFFVMKSKRRYLRVLGLI